MNRLQCLIRLARALDYNRDPDPEHRKTINGAKVHLDKNGNYDGGAGGKFNGNHHYGGPDWKQKKEAVNSLYHAFSSVAKQKQAQGNQPGNSPSQNVASKATQNGGGNGTIKRKFKRTLSVSRGWHNLQQKIYNKKIEAVRVKHHTKQPTEAEIIKRISGDDKTPGSCASVAYTYIANRCGLDVLDFRGGESHKLFWRTWVEDDVMNFPGIKGKKIKVAGKQASEGAKILLSLIKNKEYYVGFAEHAAIVKNTDEGVKYLELQNEDPARNGWIFMGKTEKQVAAKLVRRFKALKGMRHSYGYPMPTYMRLMEVDSFKGCKDFEKMAKYFNTNEKDQQKGVKGYAK